MFLWVLHEMWNAIPDTVASFLKIAHVQVLIDCMCGSGATMIEAAYSHKCISFGGDIDLNLHSTLVETLQCAHAMSAGTSKGEVCWRPWWWRHKVFVVLSMKCTWMDAIIKYFCSILTHYWLRCVCWSVFPLYTGSPLECSSTASVDWLRRHRRVGLAVWSDGEEDSSLVSIQSAQGTSAITLMFVVLELAKVNLNSQ